MPRVRLLVLQALAVALCCTTLAAGQSCVLTSALPRPLPGAFCVQTALSADPSFFVPVDGTPPAPFEVDVMVALVEAYDNEPLGDAPVAWTVNGVDVTGSFSKAGRGLYGAKYTTRPGIDDGWPWLGLVISARFADANGVTTALLPPTLLYSSLTSEGPEAATRGFPAGADPPACVAFGDINRDEMPDVFVCGAGLFENDGTGNFQDVTHRLPDVDVSVVTSAAFLDVNSDGFLDVYLVTAVGENGMYVHAGPDTYLLESGGLEDAGVGRAVTVADLNLDGLMDVVVGNDGADAVYLRVSQRSVSGFSQSPGLTAALNGGGAVARPTAALAVADVTGDDLPDVVVAHPTDWLRVLVAPAFSDATPVLSHPVFGVHDLMVQDVNGDGTLDVVAARYNASSALLYGNRGSGRLELQSTLLPISARLIDQVSRSEAGLFTSVAPWDLDLDGDLDLVMGEWERSDRVFYSGGPVLLADVAEQHRFRAGVASATVALAVADVDGDGDGDVLNPGAGQLILSSNAHAYNPRWLQVRLLDSLGAPAAYGSTVVVTCVDCPPTRPWVAVRHVSGGSGVSVHGYAARFGLPLLNAVYNVTVVWPPGHSPQLATWQTHPGLGGISPLLTPAWARRITVRQAPFALSVPSLPPWPTPSDPPPAGTPVRITVESWPPAFNLVLTPGAVATVNDQDVSHTFRHVSNGRYEVTFTTPALPDGPLWPWHGLHLRLSLSDSGGTAVQVLGDAVIPGVAFEASPGMGIDVSLANVRGAAVGDLDSDGHAEVLLAGFSSNSVFVFSFNTDTGEYEDRTAAWGLPATVGMQCIGVSVADVNRDAHLDILVTGNGATQLWLNNGTHFEDASVAFGVASITNADYFSWGDFDGDRRVDLVLRYSSSLGVAMLRNDGDRFTDVATANSLQPAARPMHVQLVDVDNDGLLDLWMLMSEHPDELYIQSVTGSFVKEGMLRGAAFERRSAYGMTADITGNGAVDLIINTLDDADPTYLMLNDGEGIFDLGHRMDVLALSRGRSAAALLPLDADADGDLDLWIGVLSSGHSDILGHNDAHELDLDLAVEFNVHATGGASRAVVAVDMDNDGDLDVLVPGRTRAYTNHNVRAGTSAYLVVRPLTDQGAPSAFGSRVVVSCTAGCPKDSWAATRVIDGGGSFFSQSQYGAHVALPWPTATYSVAVFFPGGGRQSPANTPYLGGLVPAGMDRDARRINVFDRPYFEDVRVVADAVEGAAVGPGTVVDVRLTVNGGAAGLAPTAGCCFVNGHQVAASFQELQSAGQYRLLYTVNASHAEWLAGGLVVTAPLATPSRLPMLPVGIAVPDSPAADVTAPALVVGCQPGAIATSSVVSLCVSCPTEAPPLWCRVNATVAVNGAPRGGRPPVVVTADASGSAPLDLGPLPDGADVDVALHVVDAAGNTGEPAALSFAMDVTPPVASFLTTPVDEQGDISKEQDATFLLACNEPGCAYEFSLDGGSWTAVTSEANASLTVSNVSIDTELLTAPPRYAAQAPLVLGGQVTGVPPGVLPRDVIVLAKVHDLKSQEVAAIDLAVNQHFQHTAVVPALPEGDFIMSLAARVTLPDVVVQDASPASILLTVIPRPPGVTLLAGPDDGDALAAPEVVVQCAAFHDTPCTLQWRAGPLDTVGTLPWLHTTDGVLPVSGAQGGRRHAVQVAGVDRAGLVGDVLQHAWTPAACPPPDVVPAVTVVGSVAVGPGARHVTFELSGPWAAGVEYSMNDGPWHAVPRPGYVTVTGAAAGAVHELRLRAVLAPACNQLLDEERAAAALVAWQELPPPPATLALVSAPPLSSPDFFSAFDFKASRPDATMECRLDESASFQPCHMPTVIGPLPLGPHTLTVRAVQLDTGERGPEVAHHWSVVSTSDSTVALQALRDGHHDLRVRATDLGGLLQAEPTAWAWRVDASAPITVADRLTPFYMRTHTSRVRFRCLGEVDPCKFCYDVNYGRRTCTFDEGVNYTSTADATYYMRVWAHDSVGNIDPLESKVWWRVDTKPPNTFAWLSGAYDAATTSLRTQADGSTVVLTTASWLPFLVDWTDETQYGDGDGDHPMLFRFGVAPMGVNVSSVPPDAAWWRPNATIGPEVTATDLPDGRSQVLLAALDPAGNLDPSPATVNVWVDTTPPVIAVPVPPPAVTRQQSVVVSVVATDTATGTGVVSVSATDLFHPNGGDGGGGFHSEADTRLRAAADGSVTVEFLLTGLADGAHRLQLAAVDAVGLRRVDTSVVVVVDTLPPVSRFTALPPPIVGTSSVSFTVAANEPAVSQASLDGGPIVAADPLTGVVTFTGVAEGVHAVAARSVDRAGNTEALPVASPPFQVDVTPPVASWAEPWPAFTTSDSIRRCVDTVDASPVSLRLAQHAGVAAARVNGSCVEVAAPPGVFAADGVYNVSVWAVDAVSLASVPLTAVWVLDRLPPVTTVLVDVAASPHCFNESGVTVCNSRADVAVTAACADGVTACEVVADVAPVRLVSSSSGGGGGGDCAPAPVARRRLEGVGAGPHVVLLLPVPGDGLFESRVWSRDAAGNTDAAAAVVRRWHVDTTRPLADPTFVSTPDAIITTPTARFVVRVPADSSPGRSTVWYRLDARAARQAAQLPTAAQREVNLEVPAPHDPQPLGQGQHRVLVWTRDQARHASTPPIAFTWLQASAAPVVAILGSPAAVSGDVSPEFRFQAVWPPGEARNGTEPAAAIEVDMGTGFQVACRDTAASDGVCVWRPSLAAGGPDRYSVNVRAKVGVQAGDPSAFGWEYKLCEGEQFAELDDALGIRCHACPRGANCGGGLTTQSQLVARRGFWAAPNTSATTFYECPVPGACLPGNGSMGEPARCAAGYTSLLCAVCADGYFEQFGQCVACDTSSGVAWLVTFAVVAVVVGVAVLFFKFREVLPVDQLKVALSMAQIIASANTAYAIPWPALFADFLNALRVFLIEAVSLTRASCAQPMTFYTSLVVTLVGFKAVLLLVVFTPVVLHRLQRRRSRHAGRAHPAPSGGTTGAAASSPPAAGARRRRSTVGTVVASVVRSARAIPWPKIFKITFLFLFVAYPGVGLKIMKVFDCLEVEGTWWLVADMRLQCYDRQWVGVAVYAAVMGGLYTVGLPLTIVVILARHRRVLERADVQDKWGFLYETYGVHAYMWEVAELLRKLLLSSMVVLLDETTPLPVTFAVMVSVVSHVAHAVWKPWRAMGDSGTVTYLLQHGSLGVTSFVFLMGLLFKVDGVRNGGDTYDLLAWAMLLACAAFVAVAVAVFAVSVTRRVRAQAGKAPQPARRATQQLSSGRAASSPLLTAASLAPSPTHGRRRGGRGVKARHSRLHVTPRQVRAAVLMASRRQDGTALAVAAGPVSPPSPSVGSRSAGTIVRGAKVWQSNPLAHHPRLSASRRRSLAAAAATAPVGSSTWTRSPPAGAE